MSDTRHADRARDAVHPRQRLRRQAREQQRLREAAGVSVPPPEHGGVRAGALSAEETLSQPPAFPRQDTVEEAHEQWVCECGASNRMDGTPVCWNCQDNKRHSAVSGQDEGQQKKDSKAFARLENPSVTSDPDHRGDDREG